jgi:HTH-type transcriptional regulator, competence development regulator
LTFYSTYYIMCLHKLGFLSTDVKMKTEKFGVKLRELRKQVGMTQRELAERVNIDFTYLSKIENGVMPPPSEKVILQLAEALNADKDELIILAGRVPSDIAEVLKNGETLQFLRADGTRKVIGASNKIRRSSDKMKQNLQIFNYKNFSKIAIAAVLVLAVAASLWFVSPLPVEALQIQITNPAGGALTSGTIGSTYSFQVKVSIEDNELLPIRNIDLKIYNVDDSATYFDQYTNLALGATGYVNYTTSGAGTDASIKATPDAMWGYSTIGAGYVEWQGAGYTFAPIVGGYGYQTGIGTTSITYDISWTPPSTWPTGGYKIDAKITAQDDKTFTQTSSAFTLSTQGGGGGTPPPAVVTVSETGSVDLSDYIDANGNTTAQINITSTDGQVIMTIPLGTRIVDAQGNPVSNIYIIVLNTPPPPPGYAMVGPAYDCGPDGATFTPAFTLTFTYDTADIPNGVSEEDLVLAYWVDDIWTMLTTTVNTVANTASANVAHFTPFAILAELPLAPAAFVTSDLSITPAEVNIGEEVTISVLVTNTGDVTDSYEVTLKIDEVLVDTEEVTLDSGASQTVTFTTTADVAGTYAVTIDGLSGTFVVTEVILPTPTPINWWLIGGISAGFIIVCLIIWRIIASRRRD